MKYILRSAIITLAVSFFMGTAMVPSVNAGEIKDWQKKIVRLVAKKQVYPRAAMRKELEGRAKVSVVIDRNGEIQKFDLLQSTGHKVLDREVPKLMGRISPLPAPPSSLSDAQLTFVLPLSWVIQ